MKILFSVGFFPTLKHPYASFIADMAKAMLCNGHEVTVIAPQSISSIFLRKKVSLPIFEEIPVKLQNDEIKYLKIHRPKVITFGERKILGKLTYFTRKFSVTNYLYKLKDTFDIAYAHFWENAHNVLGYVNENNVPMVVVSGEDIIVLQKFLSKHQINNLRISVKKVICVSTKNKLESIEKGLCGEDSCVIIPNGADSSKFYPLSQSESRNILGFNKNDFIVAFVGRFIERKGQIRIIKALELLSDPNVKGIFIGKSSSPNQEPYGKYVAFKGLVPHDEICMYLNAADVFILPSLAEGCSNSIVEAMACALPIISSDRPFNYDIIDSSNGILIDPNNISELACSIKKLKDNIDLRKQMSEASLNKAKEFSFENRVKKIMNIIDDIKQKK